MARTYKIGEAAALLNLKAYVLRFWESEFPLIAPLRTESGRRLYTGEDLALLERIRYLLHEVGLTIGGARKILDEEQARGVRYVAGVPGALVDGDPDGGLAGAHTAASSGDGPDRENDDDNDIDPDEADDDALRFPFPPPPLRPEGRRSGQLKLPGLEQLLPLLAGIAGNAGAAARPDRGLPDPARDTGRMLPLFTAVRRGDRDTGAGAFFGKGALLDAALRDRNEAMRDGRSAAELPDTCSLAVEEEIPAPAAGRLPAGGGYAPPGAQRAAAADNAPTDAAAFLQSVAAELETLASALRAGSRS
ncbi:MAG: MerR family transcriptional regulator [Desulfovibrio sp.]|jgi:DNA-binding transcriptional MerR regulator|nr:MerR family transcriptional regulator [Desulfovibrio sp.]